MKAMDPKYIEILKHCDTPTVNNVIELFGVRPQTEGFLHHSIRALFPDFPPMVGYAVTMKCRLSEKYEGPAPLNDTGKQVEAILEVPAPRIWVIKDVDDGAVGACFGELGAATYMAFGCVGVVSSGGLRDTPAVRKRGLPLFSRSQNVAHGYPHILALNEPVEVGGVTIRPGDLLHGDADGVTTVPVDLAPQVALMCERFLAAEKEWLNYADSGKATVEGVRAALRKYASFQQQAKEEISRQLAADK